MDATTYGNKCFQEQVQLPAGLPDEVTEVAQLLYARISQTMNVSESEDCESETVILTMARPRASHAAGAHDSRKA